MNRPRRFIWLALLGWLAQAFVPAAHAATTARHLLNASWCGDGTSAAITAQLAAFPVEIRTLLRDSLAHAGTKTAMCDLACVGSAGAPLPPTIVAATFAGPVRAERFTFAPAWSIADQDSPTATRGPPRTS